MHTLFSGKLFAAVALFAALAVGYAEGFECGLAVYLAANLLTIAPSQALGAASANTVDAGLKRQILHNTFLEAFRTALLPLNAFSTDFSDAQVDEGGQVDVGYVPLAAAARDFTGSYIPQKSDYQKKKVTIDKHKFVSWGLSDKDLYSKPLVNLQVQFRQKAHALASAVLADILGIITAAKFGDAVFTGAASGFDLDDVADIRTACVKAKWPAGARSLVMAADYYGAVIKDGNMQDASAAGSTEPRTTGVLPTLYGFRPFESEAIPDNNEHLVGFANMPSAIAVAMRYLQPRRPEKYVEAKPLKDPDTGITIGFRHDYDTNTGFEWMAFECNYGFEELETAALKRMVSQ